MTARKQNDVGIGHPIGRRNNHLVARVERRHHGVEDHLLAARRGHDLTRLIIEPVLTLEFAADRFLQLRDAVHVRVFGLAVPDRLDGRFLDVVRRVEIRLACAEADHVLARRFQLARLGRYGDCRRGLHAGKRVGQESHGQVSVIGARYKIMLLRRPRKAERAAAVLESHSGRTRSNMVGSWAVKYAIVGATATPFAP